MKKIVAVILTAILVLSSFVICAFGEENAHEYTKSKVFTGTYGCGETEITVLTNDAEDIFDITFTCFDDEQELIGTVENGSCNVSFDKSGFMGRDCQQIWEDALASETPWEAPAVKAEAAEEETGEDPYALENIAPLENAPLAGKKLIFLGSSVTEGVKTGISFVDYIGARNGCEIIKEAVGGTTLVNESGNSYIPRMETIDPEFEADAFICQLSTNDASGEKALGEISESMNKEDFDTTTVAGAIEYIIAYAKETWDCPVIFYTNPKYDNEHYASMVAILEDIAEKWDIDLVNLWEDEDINKMIEEDRKNLLYDFIHPRPGFYLDVWTPYFENAIGNVIAQ